jgi:hypothetical protein
LRTARSAIANERATFEQKQMGASAQDENDDLPDYHISASDDEYANAKSEVGESPRNEASPYPQPPSWLIAESPQQSVRETVAEERHIRNNSPTRAT